jgi:hypothetical protein
MLALVTLTTMMAVMRAHASSPEAWAAHKAEVAAKCKQASGLKNPRLVGQLVEYDDSVGFTAALIVGVYPQPHMRQQPGRSLCLFDRRNRTAQAAPADSLKQP